MRSAPRSSCVVMLSQLFSGAATAWALLLGTRVLDSLLHGGLNPEQIRAKLPSLLLLSCAYLLRIVMDASSSFAKAIMVPKVHRTAEEDLLKVSLKAELTSFDDSTFYDRLHRARDRGVMHIEGATICLVDFLRATFSLCGAAFALIWLQPVLFPILLLALLPEGWAALYAAKLQYAGMSLAVSLFRQTHMMAEIATQREAAPEIRANQAEDYVLAEYHRSATELQNHLVTLGTAEARANTIGRVVSGFGVVGTFVALGLMVNAHWLPLAVAGIAVIAIRSAADALTQLIQVVHELFEKGLYISDYREFIEQSTQPSGPAERVKAPGNPGRIELKEVEFHYPSAGGRVALKGITLTIEPRQTIALVGENGSGKTTLAKLIAGLYHPTSGKITWDGVDLKDIDPDSLADRVAVVLQDPIRWPRSAEDNIRLGRHTRADPDLVATLRAAEQSCAIEVVAGLPEGWKTLLSREFRGGQDLSSGQWQRLAVARGLYRDGPLVIWDEPTAPLDAKAEHAVYESLRQVARERTVVLITHRLVTVRNADRIFFLENGTVVEQGRHDDLMRDNGRYAQLYRLQTNLHGLVGC